MCIWRFSFFRCEILPHHCWIYCLFVVFFFVFFFRKFVCIVFCYLSIKALNTKFMCCKQCFRPFFSVIFAFFYFSLIFVVFFIVRSLSLSPPFKIDTNKKKIQRMSENKNKCAWPNYSVAKNIFKMEWFQTGL